MEKIYGLDPNLVIEPDYYSDGVPIFKPTMKEFEDFYKFNKAINKYGMESGIVKIIPPKEWVESLAGSYNQENLETIKIKNPIVQHISGSGSGIYSQQNIERSRSYNIFQWKELSEKSNYQPPAPKGKPRGSRSPDPNYSKDSGVAAAKNVAFTNRDSYNIDTTQFTKERCEQLEKIYWKSLTYAEPMYGADMLGSLFTDATRCWNVAHLPNILDLMDTKLPGVNDAYLYAGLWKATFAWHLEDQDLYSINYLHFGAPKQWYSIPQSESKKFFELMKDTFNEEYRSCSEFLRHKTFLVSPNFLRKNGLTCNKIIHKEGEFIITYPYGYHAGFNYGYNLAESVNFALDDWFPIGEITRKCECINDAVAINVKQLYCRFKGIPYEYSKTVISEAVTNVDGADGDKAPTKAMPDKHVGLETKKKEGKKNSQRKLKPKSNTANVTYECYLCPNNLPSPLLKSNQFELLNTDLPNNTLNECYKVHRICAEMFPNQISVFNNFVYGLSSISKAQKKLRCVVCEPSSNKKSEKHGACFQCNYSKCVRSFHGTCGLGDGVSYKVNNDNSNNLCKYHRNKSSSCNRFEKLARLKQNSLIQFSIKKSKRIHCGYIISNNIYENSFDVSTYPSLYEIIEVHYDDVLIGPIATEIDNSYFLEHPQPSVKPKRPMSIENEEKFIEIFLKKRKSDSSINYSSNDTKMTRNDSVVNDQSLPSFISQTAHYTSLSSSSQSNIFNSRPQFVAISSEPVLISPQPSSPIRKS